MKETNKALLSKVFGVIKKVAVAAWTVPAVKSQLLTWVVRLGVPSGLATIAFAVAEAMGVSV